MLDDKYINNFANNLVSAVFHFRVIWKSVLYRFLDLCVEAPYCCPSEGHQHGCHKVVETSVVEWCY